MEHILQINPDIILLQEVMNPEYKKLIGYFENKYIISPLVRINWNDIKNNSGNVSLFKRTEFSHKYMSHSPLDYGVHTNCVYKNHHFTIYNVHLNDASIRKRYQQMNAKMPSLLDAKLCIIGGDFNHQYRQNTKLYDIPRYTIHNTTCPTYFVERKMNIDNILTKGFRNISPSSCPAYPENTEKGFIEYGSDHLPVVINIAI
jgi:endonuclease/exonuclease/phosphatase family metal-dependent hydrolase